ncbi:hypothetical protein H257_19459 [Aphanomyces astaci]|uniref:Uncharacterized protein n=1 Tax=Aphanomyces astaci TaxID=112090 RepID=W4FA84_APHAT|nr:hypothetical protein H257_19459 [Aphanomyces astaci]ETV63613.1 hypothetical protein H257_19459 [Aphanomyces astaci]|eukprot:XP_009846904.1 hypothetical protein H257_19459 [Aphanomyces astaci]
MRPPSRHQAAGSGVASKVTPKMTPDTDKNKLTLTTTVSSSPVNSNPRVTPTATTKTMMPPLHGTSAAPRAMEGSYEDPDERIEYLTDEAHNTPGLPLDATLQTSITQQPNKTYTNTESPRLQAVDPASFKDATIPSPLTNAKADTRPPGLKATVRSQKTATSQATTTATTPGIQSFKNRRSKKLRPPATPGPRSATSGAPTNLATTPGYETGHSPGVTPVFTEAQIEAIMRGDLTGIPEARHVDIEERLYPVSPATWNVSSSDSNKKERMSLRKISSRWLQWPFAGP